MKNKVKVFGIIIFAMIIGFSLTACPDSSSKDSPTVTSVTVSAAGGATSVAKGSNLQFSAVVAGSNKPGQGVTWSIDTASKNAGTTINADGLLTVAAAETQTSLTIRATSKVNTSKFGTANVSVTTSGPGPGQEQGTEELSVGMISGDEIIASIDKDTTPGSIIVKADSSHTGFKWYKDGILVTDSNGKSQFIIDLAAETAGQHTLTVEAVKDERPYASTYFYRVAK